MSFTDLLDTLGYDEGEHLSLNYQPPGGQFLSQVVAFDQTVQTRALSLADGQNVWFGVNPIGERLSGRGGANDVTRWAAIWCDLDVKAEACQDIDHAYAIVDELSAILGSRPSAIVHSGHGLQPYWPIDDGQISASTSYDGPPLDEAVTVALRAEAAALLKRWGRLACVVAERLGAKIDRGVYDLARVLRVPGTFNLKGEPIAVSVEFDTGAPISIEELRERLDEAGVCEYEGDRSIGQRAVLSAPSSWESGVYTCEYFAPTIKAWRTEPITERHPWLVRQCVRIMAAQRNGCLTADTYRDAVKVVTERFQSECARDKRAVPDFEIPNALAWAEMHVAGKTDDELATEYGRHLHLDELANTGKTLTLVASKPDQPIAGPTVTVSPEGSLAQVVDLNEHRLEVTATVTLTDTGNADLLVEAWGARLRYCPDSGKWLSWSSTRWRTSTDGGEAMTAARKVVESIEVEKGDKETAKHKIKSLGRRSLENMVALAKCNPSMRVALGELDAQPYALNTPSGIVDLRTGELSAHTPEGWHTKQTGVPYDATAEAPRWAAFLRRTFGGDREMVAYMQRLAGYTAIGEVTHHVLPFLFGGGQNGKSVFMEVLAGVLGDYAISAPANFLLAGRDRHETEIARLHGARLVVCSEVNQGSKFDEAKVKLLTGGDTLTGRYMRADFFDFTPSHSLFLMGNHKPEVEGGGTSFWRRLQVIPFRFKVPDHERIEGLQTALVEEEGAAILAWIVAGARTVIERGLDAPDCVRVATAEYAEQEDALARFLSECCEIDNDGRDTTMALVVGRSFQLWAFANGEKEVSSTKLGRELATRFGVQFTKTRGGKAYKLRVRPEWLPHDVAPERAGAWR
ncbi:MAG: DNA primase family protein [Mycobacterium sp.]